MLKFCAEAEGRDRARRRNSRRHADCCGSAKPRAGLGDTAPGRRLNREISVTKDRDNATEARGEFGPMVEFPFFVFSSALLGKVWG